MCGAVSECAASGARDHVRRVGIFSERVGKSLIRFAWSLDPNYSVCSARSKLTRAHLSIMHRETNLLNRL